MLRHTVLCLVLAFQCTTAIEWDELGDRVEKYYDKQEFPDYRDDWFWSDRFWRYPHMMRMECPDGYGWEGDYKSGECKICEAGQYSASWGPTVRCTKCPPRFYQPNAGSSKCMRCPEYSPISGAGSKSAKDCKKLADDKMRPTTSATFMAEVEVSGDYRYMNEMLNELSGYPAFGMSASFKYDETKDSSMGTVRFSMARRAAFEAYMYVQELKTMLPFVNDWISTGQSYVNRIFSMLNVAETFSLLGLNMDSSEIFKQMKGMKVMKIDSMYYENCEANQLPYETYDKSCPGMMFCETDGLYKEADVTQRYLSYTGNSDACMTLGGVNKMRKWVSEEWMTKGCGKAENCKKSLMKCEYDQTKKESWIVVYVSKKYATKLDDDFFKDIKFMDRKNVEFKLNKQFTADTCPGGPKESTSVSCDAKCADNQVVSWENGRCGGCPFGSFMDKDGTGKCYPCDWVEKDGQRLYDYFVSETYMPNAVGKDSCFAYYGDKTVIADKDIASKFYRIDRRPFDIPRDNRQRYKVDIEGKLSVCYAIQLKEDFGKFCNDKYTDLKSLSFKDFTNFDLTKLSCLVRDRIGELYKSNCGNRKYSWPTTDNFYWLNAACMAVSQITKTEESMKDKSIKCEDVDDSIRYMTMPFSFQRGFSNDLDWGSVLIPLLQPVDSMMKADFSTVTSAVKGAMEGLGLYKTSMVTGLKMTDYVRDLIIKLPENLKMSKGSWEMMNKKEDVFCANNKVKKDCRSACAMPYNQCMQKSGDSFDLTCTADECNDCAVTYTYEENSQKKEYQCVGVCKNLLNPSNGFVSLITGNPDKKGEKLTKLACNKGFRVKADAEFLKKCMDEKPKSYTCDENGNAKETFECVADKCSAPTDKLENGFIKSWNPNPERSCRYVEMACNPGFMMKGERMRYCDAEGNWMGDMPKCEPAKCSDKDTSIENGMFINDLVGSKMSWYRCNINNPTYKGETDYFAANNCGEKIVCGEGKKDRCPPTIANGYKVREWKQMSKEKKDREKEVWNGQYRCNANFVLKDNELFKGDKDKSGWSQCTDEGDKLPSCVPADDGSGDDMKPCKMPEVIYNGYMVKGSIIKNDKGEETSARYECNKGFMMIETMKKDYGFCRVDWDRSYELPYCVMPKDWNKMEFELVGGYAKMKNAGRVKAREVYWDNSVGEWYAGCDDNFNSPAAGSICRTIGFRYGKMIDAPKKMRPIEDVPFGITNFWCYYDDVLPNSKNCNAEEYGKLGYPLCMPDEQLSVSCFDTWWKVDVKFELKAKRKYKMYCPVEIEKEGNVMKTKKMGLTVTWGGLKENKLTGKWDYTEFKEGVQYEEKKFRKKKGFRAIYIGDINTYDCFYCNVWLGKNWMNPTDPNSKEPTTNNNCGKRNY